MGCEVGDCDCAEREAAERAAAPSASAEEFFRQEREGWKRRAEALGLKLGIPCGRCCWPEDCYDDAACLKPDTAQPAPGPTARLEPEQSEARAEPGQGDDA